MSAIVNVSENLNVGQETVIESPSPFADYAVVFEDDGDTGYFYALDTARSEGWIQDAMHIYNVNAVADRHLPSEVRIGWTEDGLRAVLLINNYPHAIFDFAAKRGYCRSNFPPPGGEWSQHHPDHAWEDAALLPFQKRLGGA